MTYTIQIEGITKSEHPDVYNAVEIYGGKFNIKKVEIEMPETGLDAKGFSCINKKMNISNKMKLPKELIQMMNHDEIEAIVAHEFIHIKNKDCIKNSPFIIFILIPLFLIVWSILSIIYPDKVSFEHDIFLLHFSIIIFIIICIILHLVLIGQELRADKESAEETNKPDSLITALEKMYSERFSRAGIKDCLKYHSNHPNLKRRIEQLELVKI